MEKEKITLKKSDILAAAAIGILAFLFSIPLIKNLESSIPFVEKVGFGNIILASALFFIPLCLVGICLGYLVGKKIPVIFQFTKFGETGGLNVLIDFGILNLLIMVIGAPTITFYALFKSISFTTATTNSYLWNKFWVFKKGEKSSTELIKFIGITLIGLAINVSIASLVRHFGSLSQIGLDQKIWDNLGAALGALAAMMWNFVGYKFWVFKK